MGLKASKQDLAIRETIDKIKADLQNEKNDMERRFASGEINAENAAKTIFEKAKLLSLHYGFNLVDFALTELSQEEEKEIAIIEKIKADKTLADYNRSKTVQVMTEMAQVPKVPNMQKNEIPRDTNAVVVDDIDVDNIAINLAAEAKPIADAAASVARFEEIAATITTVIAKANEGKMCKDRVDELLKAEAENVVLKAQVKVMRLINDSYKEKVNLIEEQLEKMIYHINND
ncbi:hypothetical protein [Clostridium sp.]|uniref:hypothetical protein n=1 Tax=Clostridium sp. TaxID=1506 RepID=UPI001A6002E6|nr:hypothetical protein [Clostridium sp.]MBK5234083.1 hypothetical protein [Clostridium sp.]